MDEPASNADLARKLYEAFGSRDDDALVALLDPQVEWELVGPE
jgi:ketosteroid isomerase-like protein